MLEVNQEPEPEAAQMVPVSSVLEEARDAIREMTRELRICRAVLKLIEMGMNGTLVATLTDAPDEHLDSVESIIARVEARTDAIQVVIFESEMAERERTDRLEQRLREMSGDHR